MMVCERLEIGKLKPKESLKKKSESWRLYQGAGVLMPRKKGEKQRLLFGRPVQDKEIARN